MSPIEKIQAWLDEQNRNQASLAKELGLSEASVSAWFLNRARPTAPYRIALERITGVAAHEWLTDDERLIAFGADTPSGVKLPDSGEAA